MRFLRAKFGYYCLDSVYIPAHLLSYTVSGKHLRKILKLFPELLSTIELLLSYMFSLIQNYLFWVFTIKPVNKKTSLNYVSHQYICMQVPTTASSTTDLIPSLCPWWCRMYQRLPQIDP